MTLISGSNPDLVLLYIFRTVQTQKIEGTNLLLVIADKPSTQCDEMPRLPQEPVKYILFNYICH